MREYLKYIYFIVFLVGLFLFFFTAPPWVIFGLVAIFSYAFLIDEENNGQTTDNREA